MVASLSLSYFFYFFLVIRILVGIFSRGDWWKARIHTLSRLMCSWSWLPYLVWIMREIDLRPIISPQNHFSQIFVLLTQIIQISKYLHKFLIRWLLNIWKLLIHFFLIIDLFLQFFNLKYLTFIINLNLFLYLIISGYYHDLIFVLFIYHLGFFYLVFEYLNLG